MGNSATVFSLQAMKMLDEENRGSPVASNEMCMFAAVSMSMLQLIPITVIQIRAMQGSAAPEDIILPSVISGLPLRWSVYLYVSILKNGMESTFEICGSADRSMRKVFGELRLRLSERSSENGEKQRYKTDAASDKVHGYSEDLCEADGRGGQR